MGRVVSREDLRRECERIRREGKRIVFTNGCFDILHAGHVRYLARARSMGDVLVIGLNSDESVRGIKGALRPINPEKERAEVLAAMASVDYVALFDEPDPAAIIREVQPDVLVKGGDWPVESIVGADQVQARGGTIVSVPFEVESSTTKIVDRILARHASLGEPRRLSSQ
jgi:rfaE bifunctional protein nucleotidyltransferase chain/domain